MTPVTEHRVVAVTDERSTLARASIALLQDAIGDVHPASYLLRELEETRQRRAPGGDYSLLAMPDVNGEPMAAVAGVYLEAVHAGFVSYLAVREDQRGLGLGRMMRQHLVEAFRGQARQATGGELGRVLGEVQRESPWLSMLMREGRVVRLDVPYFHPWMSRRWEGYYVLYLEPLADRRTALPARELERLVDAVWRRAYRISNPEDWDTWRYMIQNLRQRASPDSPPGL